ncbi:hypothetical protein Ndes2526B_g04148 [Nannochloris sp. 'desiccata']
MECSRSQQMGTLGANVITMLRILRRASSTRKTLHIWSNPAIVSRHLSEIFSEYRSEYKVEPESFSRSFSSSTSSSPLDDKQPTSLHNDTTTTITIPPSKTSIKKIRNAAFQDFKRSLVRGQPSAAAAALDKYNRLSGGAPSRPLYHSLMDLYSRKGDAESVIKILNEMIKWNNPPPNEYTFGYAISALKKNSARAGGTDKMSRTATAAALQALELFEIMISLKMDLTPNFIIYNELIDCFGRAGDVDQAFKLFHRALTIDKIKPTVHTFSILIKACAVAKQPDRASDVVFKLMPQHGFVPGAAAWNGLLGAAAGAAGGGVDRAYEVWQKMIDAGVLPDMHTERALAKAFASHPQLAAELVGEARTLAEESKKEKKGRIEKDNDSSFRSGNGEIIGNVDITSLASQRRQLPAPSISESFAAPSTPSKQQPILLDELRRKRKNISAHKLGLAPDFFGKPRGESFSEPQQRQEGGEYQQDDDADYNVADDTSYPPKDTATTHVSKLLSLDLHGHSQAAAEMTLLCRLEALVEAWPEISLQLAQHEAQHAQHATTNTNSTNNDLYTRFNNSTGLVIITGVGKGSRDGLGVLKHAVRAILTKQGLTAVDVPDNPGRIFIPLEKISTFAEKQWERMQRDHFYAAARARYAGIGVGIAGVVAAAVIIPRLGPWLI